MQLLGKTRLWMKWLSCLETDVRTLSLSWSYHPLCSVPYRLIYLWSITLAHSVSCLSSLQLSPVLIMCSYFHLLPDVVIPLYLLSFSICSIHTIIPLSLQCCLIHSFSVILYCFFAFCWCSCLYSDCTSYCISCPPVLSTQHLSYDDCLEVRRGDNQSQNCSVLYCVRQLCTVINTRMWTVVKFVF